MKRSRFIKRFISLLLTILLLSTIERETASAQRANTWVRPYMIREIFIKH